MSTSPTHLIPSHQSINPSLLWPASKPDRRTDRQTASFSVARCGYFSPSYFPESASFRRLALPYLTTFASTLLSLFVFFFHSPPRSFARSLLLGPD
ncbi:hypothetical protein GQ607_006235 [Colletotrichum asianum]|uniref:Uncharacterized protein n=1 Tax=Colletotrichum asianum TaxID=702518 RepID=A0A8H3ZT93_9PEZI|nr:hypothetical protein GQ607_006235 [Colletotrichum asianum]